MSQVVKVKRADLPPRKPDAAAAVPYIPNPSGPPPGKRLLTRIREMLKERAIKKDANGNPIGSTRFDTVAHTYVDAMEAGSFPHIKEFIDREEGRSPSSPTDVNVKLYVNMPTEGNDAP